MGLYISVVDVDYNEHPDWDSGKFHGDRELAAALDGGPVIGDPRDSSELVRPPEGAVLPGVRGQELMAILRDPKWWVHVSY